MDVMMMSATFGISLTTPRGRLEACSLHAAVIAGLACALLVGKAMPVLMDTVATVVATVCGGGRLLARYR